MTKPDENTVESENEPEATWESLGLSEEMLSEIRKAGFEKPTPVQAQAIPPGLEGKDVIASAQTGTGKTAAFTFPMLDRFSDRQGTFGLILAPTREIALQIFEVVKQFGEPRGLRAAAFIGGVDYRKDEKALETYPHILVGTPGRMCDHLERGNLWLEFIEVFVLDEADRMLDMGFAAQLNMISDAVSDRAQTLLFSATFPPAVEKLARKITTDPVRVKIGQPHSAAKTVDQKLVWVKQEHKEKELKRLLDRLDGTVMIFTRTKNEAVRLWRSLHAAGFHEATYISSDRQQKHREQALESFKSGEVKILIATDVAGRGIHVDKVGHVVNFDLPMEPEDYIHRIGRTGRAEESGHAVTFATPRDRRTVAAIEKLIGKELPAEYARGFDPDAPAERGGGNGRGRGPRGGRGGGGRGSGSRGKRGSGSAGPAKEGGKDSGTKKKTRRRRPRRPAKDKS